MAEGNWRDSQKFIYPIYSYAKPKIYLAGPMGGLSWEDANSWRLDLTFMLGPQFEILNPMRGKTPETWAKNGPYPEYLFYSSDLVITRDLNDVEQASALVVNFPYKTPHGIGTAIEMGTAIPLRKPVIIVLHPDDLLRQHPFIKCFPRGCIVSTLLDVVQVLKSLFNME